MSENAPPPTPGRPHRAQRADAVRLRVWIAGTSILFIAGLLLAQTSPYSAVAVWSWREARLLLLALIPCVFLGVPAALVALQHPWASALLQAWEQRFNHPRLLNLTLIWANVFLSGWLIAIVLLVPPVSFMYVGDVVMLLVGFGPSYAILLFDRRR